VEEAAPAPAVDINTASASELATLLGVDETVAAAVVECREANGPFSSLDDLADVPGISSDAVLALNGRVSFGSVQADETGDDAYYLDRAAAGDVPPDTGAAARGAGDGADLRTGVEISAAEEQEYTINLEDANIATVLELYSRFTGKTVIKGQGVTDAMKVTVINPMGLRLTAEAARRVLDTALDVNGLTAVEVGDVIRIVPHKEAQTEPIPTVIEAAEGPADDRMVTMLRSMRFIDANALATQLRSFVSTGVIFAVQATNALVVADSAANVERLMRIADYLDVEVSAGSLKVELIPLEYASEEGMEAILNEIFGGSAPSRQASRVPQPQREAQPQPQPGADVVSITAEGLEDLRGKVKIIPDKRLRALVVITTDVYMGLVRALVEKLDVPGEEGPQGTNIIRLKNAKAEDLASVLESLFSGVSQQQRGDQPSGRPMPITRPVVVSGGTGVQLAGLIGDVTVVSDERTNSLIISTDPRNYPIIDEIIKKLDIRTDQVMLETLIAEVDLSATGSSGVQLTELVQSWNRSKYRGTLGFDTGAAQLASSLNYVVVRDGTNTALEALLTLYEGDSNVQILSKPRILVSDNGEASINVVEEIPIPKLTVIRGEDGAATGEREQSFEYKDVGLEVSVKPRISENRDVVLDLSFNYSNIGRDDPVTGQHVFLKRESETSVVVPHDRTLVVGGLITTNKSTTETRVPILGRLPILGWFFKSRNKTDSRTELIVFLTPKVIRTAEEGDAVTKHLEDEADMEGTPRREEARQLYEGGMEAYKDENWYVARDRFEQALELSPGLDEVQEPLEKTLGIIERLEEKQAAAAAREEERRLRLRVDILMTQGRSAYRRGEYMRAIDAWEKVLDIHPEHRSAKRYISDARERLERELADRVQ